MTTETKGDVEEESEFEERWGLQVHDVYKIALKFYKEKNGGKALTLSYNDRLKLLALTKQVCHGKYDPSFVPDNGLFDVVGNNRRQVWKALGDISKSTAMMEFIRIVDSICPLFAPVVQAHKIEKEEEGKRRKAELDELEIITRAKQEEELKKQQELVQKQMAQEMLIRSALNQQTYNQFRSYAQLQHPNNVTQQEALVSQLQEQHFLQYMHQVYNQQQHYNTSQQLFNLQQQKSVLPIVATTNSLSTQVSCALPFNGAFPTSNCSLPSNGLEDKNRMQPSIQTNCEVVTSNAAKTIIEAALLWTRKDIQSFKESLKAENEAIIKVGSGELVTIRVPTHQNGISFFWEFATDNLDIGFGLSFEWKTQEEEKEGDATNVDDCKTPVSNGEDCSSQEKKIDVIVPIVRRQSHMEVQCGSHQYPGSGVYLLMFENSYSMWRSKSVYYRVFYSH